MQHIGIDLGGRESQVCVRSEDGTILWEGKRSTGTLERWLKTQPRSRVILETSAEAFAVADGAFRAGHDGLGRNGSEGLEVRRGRDRPGRQRPLAQ